MWTLIPHLILIGLLAGCGEEEEDSAFGTPTPEPTPWPIPGDDDTEEVGSTPEGTPPPRALSNIPLSQATTVLEGEYPGDYAGYSVAIVGDVNGDGFDDLAIGAPLSDALQDDGGKVYLVFGGLFGPESGSLGTTMASFVGEGLGDRAGQMVAAAGDVNGDGLDDLLIGAPFNDLGGPDAGRVYVILGRTTGWYPEMRLTHADFSFYGNSGELVGDLGTLAGGDINGDGLSDIVIGVPHSSDSSREAGKVCIITGRESGWDKKAELSTVAFQLLGTDSDDWTGFSVDVVPDVNEDGRAELLIGAPHSSVMSVHGGQAYLFLGRPSLPVLSADVTNMSNASWVGAFEGEEAGVGVAGAGDVTGDGFQDFVIGAWGVSSNRGYGRFYLVQGQVNYADNPEDAVSLPLSLSMATITPAGDDYIGRPGIGVGDTNGDGFDDLLLGDYLADSPGIFEKTGGNAGAAYFFFGRTTPAWATIANVSQADYVFYGESSSNYAGHALGGNGDLNDDGYPDLAIGAFGAGTEARPNVGRVYVYYGGDPFQPPYYQQQ